MSTPHKIMVGNDDGINSIGIDLLAKYASKWGDITIVSPASQQTASGKALTFHKPLRVKKDSTQSGIPGYSYNTFPADGVIIYEHLKGKPDIVLSGINAGENTSIHSVLTSGTCAVAMEGGLKNIPAFAFSMDVPEIFFQSDDIPGNIDLAARISIDIAKTFVNNVNSEFWKKIIFVNVNFPDELDENTEIIVTHLDTYKYINYLRERKDPKGDDYYWLWGDKREDFDMEADSAQVCISKKVVVTPIAMSDHEYLFPESKRIIDLYNTSK